MKKTLLYFMILILTLTCFNFTVMAEETVNVVLDGEQVFFDVPPQIINGRTMVPMRAIFEKLGAVVDWNDDTRTVIAQKGDVKVGIAIDETSLYKIEFNDEKLQSTYRSLPEASGVWLQAQHILIQRTDDETGLKKAKTILSDLKKNPSKFEEFMKKYNEDPGVANQPDGYIFNDGMMVDEFYNGALNIKEGAISDIVESPYGYHIIRKVKQWNNGIPYEEIEQQVKESYLYSNTEEIKLDVPAQLIGGRTLVPLRAVSEAFDCYVFWNDETKTVRILSSESFVDPPKNIRIVRQEDDAVYIQWDEVNGAEYYHFYYQEDGEEDFWYDVDDNGEKLKMFYDSEYTTEYWGLENGKKYNIIVTSVKNGVESLDSETFSFVFNSSSSQETAFNALKNFILSNSNDVINGYPTYKELYKNGNVLNEYMLDYDAKSDAITLTAVYRGSYITHTYVTLTPDENSCFSMILYRSSSKKSYDADFAGTFYINTNNFNVNSKVSFIKTEGDTYNTDTYKTLALMNSLEALDFADYIFKTYLSHKNVSLSDFGFNVPAYGYTPVTFGNPIKNNENNYQSENNAPTNNYQDGGYYLTNTKITFSSFPLYLYADDGTGTFLGEISSNEYDTDSIANEYGKYGNEFQTKSIFNEFGTYGSEFSRYSPFNEFATKPPKILDKNGKVVGYLTANKYIKDAISYEEMMVLLKKFNK